MLANNDMPVLTRFFPKATLLRAVEYGEIRTGASLHRKDAWGLKNDDPVADSRRQVIGVLGEWAVSNFFGHSYEFTVNTFKAPDVVYKGVGIQVKSSEYARALTIRPDAKDKEPYVLAHVQIPYGDPRNWQLDLDDGTMGRVELLGWLFPHQARMLAEGDPSLVRDPGNRNSPAIFVPVDLLHHMWTLEEWIDIHGS